MSYERIKEQEESTLHKFRAMLKKHEKKLSDHDSGVKPLDERVRLISRVIEAIKQ